MLALTAELSQSLDQAAALILHSKHVVALAGAGLSVESGYSLTLPLTLVYQEFRP